MRRVPALIITLVILAAAAIAQRPDEVRVTLLHLNDTYQFMPVDGGKRGGFARILTIAKRVRAENKNTLMTLGGDTLSPSVETRTYKGAQMVDAWNQIGLDLAVFGNHEFDLKTPDLLQRMAGSKFKWLGANVVEKKTGAIFADTPPYIIRDLDGVKVGFIGLLLPETKETSSMDGSLAVNDPCETANKLVPEMRKAGAGVIVGLTHLFMGQDKRLARCVDLDLILGGHEHTLLQSSSNGTPIFKMWADGREMGRFDLFIDRKTGRLNSMDWEIIPITDAIPDDPDFAPVVAKYKELLDKLAVRVGTTAVAFDALSESVRTKETAIGNFIADSYRKAVDADVAMLNGGSIRADLIYSPGPLTMRDVLSILPFNNPIVKVEITGKTLADILEHGVGRSAEDSQPGRFPQVSGMSFRFDAAKPPGQRVTEILVAGKPLDEKKTYTIATSDFLVSRGGDGYTMFKSGKVLIPAETAPKDSELLEKAIKESPNSTITPRVEGRVIRIN